MFRSKLPAARAGASKLVKNPRLFFATLAITCATFSGAVNAATLDFKVSDLSEISLGPGGYVTELESGVGVSQSWGVGVMGSWIDSTRDVVLPAGTPPPNYWESYTFLFNTPGAPEWPNEASLMISARTDSSGMTSLNIERIPSTGMMSAGAEGGTIELDGATLGQSSVYDDIFVNLDQSWVDFGNGRIFLSEYGEPGIASVWHVPYFMEIESGYFKETHLVYEVMSVPEPETWAMLLAGLGLVAGAARRRRA